MQSQISKTIHQLTGRVWLLSVLFSSTLMAIIFYFNNQHFHSSSDLFHILVFKSFPELPLMFGYIAISHLILGLPALFVSSLGFYQIKKANLPELQARTLMIILTTCILIISCHFIFNSLNIQSIGITSLYVMLFASSFIVMTDDELVKAVSSKEK